MSAAALAALLSERHGLAASRTGEAVTVEVSADAWLAAATVLRQAEGVCCAFFDWLSAYEEVDGGLVVLLHVAAVPLRHRALLRTRLPAAGPAALPSLTGLWAGAGWHERETHEMFGVDFPGHPALTPLLLPAGAGTPLRKTAGLLARQATAWPGAHDPSGRARRRPRPPGG